MAEWQVNFHVVPKRALAAHPTTISRAMLDAGDWWAGGALPADYRERLAAIAPPDRSPAPGVEAWGPEDGNRIEVASDAGRTVSVRARFDARRPDAKFAAGLITFVRIAGAALVRDDGWVTEPTAGGLGLAMRRSPAWKFVRDPLA